VSSIRLKLIRQGMQDYEWLRLVERAGDAAFARSVVPAAYRVGDDGAAFDEARARLIARYLVLAPSTPAEPSPPAAEGGDAPTPSPDVGPQAPEALSSSGATNVAAVGAGCSATGTGLPASAAAALVLLALARSRQRRRAPCPVRRREPLRGAARVLRTGRSRPCKRRAPRRPQTKRAPRVPLICRPGIATFVHGGGS
jgi:uncharacterized protein (TIGR03382 family)